MVTISADEKSLDIINSVLEEESWNDRQFFKWISGQEYYNGEKVFKSPFSLNKNERYHVFDYVIERDDQIGFYLGLDLGSFWTFVPPKFTNREKMVEILEILKSRFHTLSIQLVDIQSHEDYAEPINIT